MRPNFKPQTFWTHEKFMDVVMLVLAKPYEDIDRIKLKVEWWNNRGMCLGVRENVIITREQFNNWKYYELSI